MSVYTFTRTTTMSDIITKIKNTTNDIIEKINTMLEDLMSIGTIPHELDEQYDYIYGNSECRTCDDNVLLKFGYISREYKDVISAYALPTECAITNDLFVPTSMVVVTRCSHVFGCDALKKWLVVSPICPICRTHANCITSS
jgi:hypothetical protein